MNRKELEDVIAAANELSPRPRIQVNMHPSGADGKRKWGYSVSTKAGMSDGWVPETNRKSAAIKRMQDAHIPLPVVVRGGDVVVDQLGVRRVVLSLATATKLGLRYVLPDCIYVVSNNRWHMLPMNGVALDGKQVTEYDGGKV